MRRVLAWSMLGLLVVGCDDGGGKHAGIGDDGGLGGDGDSGVPGGGEPPTANAGADQSVMGGAFVTLDGSGSRDPEGSALRYTWRQRSGSPVGLKDENSAHPSFDAPGLTQQMTFELVVNDGALSSAPDTVVINVDGYSGKRADVLGDPLSEAPILLGNRPVDLELAGERLVIADEQEGVKIAALTDPLRPNVLGTHPTPSQDVEVRWPHVFSLSTEGNLFVLDATNPSQPIELATVNGASNSSAYFSANASVGVISVGVGGVQVVDTSGPGLQVLAKLNEPGASGFQLVGNRLYLSSQNGLRIYDLTNPSSPTLLGTFDDDAGAWLTRVVGNLAIVRGRDGTTDVVRLIDVTNPAAPTARGQFPADNTGADVTGSTLCVSLWNQDDPGINVVDIANLDAPSVVGFFSTASAEHPRAESVRAQGNYCYVRRFLGVDIVDVSTPASPELTASLNSGSRDILVSGNYLYASVYQGLEVHDISNPASPSLVTKLDLPGDTSQLTLAGSRLYITSDIVGVFVVDVSNPSAPKLLHELSVPLELTNLDLRGERLYGTFKTTFASVEGLQIYDVSDASKPALLGTYRSGDAIAVDAPADEEAAVYVHRYTGGVERVDVREPGHPVSDGVQSQWCTDRHLAAAGEHAYCSSSNALYTLDFSVSPPVNRGTSDLGRISSLRYASPYLFAGIEDSWEGLFAIDPLDLQGPLAWAQKLGRDADPMALAIGPSHVYAALRAGGVSAQRFAPNLAADPIVELAFDMYGVTDVLAQDARLYIARYNELQVYDISQTTPKLLASTSLPFEQRRLAVHAGAVVVVESARLRVLDPSLASLAELEIEPWQSMASSGDRLYLTGASGLRQFDLSKPRAPTLRATYAPLTYGVVAAQGELAYASGSGVFGQTSVIDFSDANAPKPVGTFVGSNPAVGAGFLAGVGATGGVDLWDLDNPTAPMLAGSRPFELFGAQAMVIDGSTLAYYAGHTEPSSDVTLLDVSALAQPVLMGRLSFLNRNVLDVALEGGRVWVLTQDAKGAHRLAAYSMAGAVSVRSKVAGVVQPGATVEFDVRWDEHDADQPEFVECVAASGTCSVSNVDGTARTATLSFTVPPTAGDYEVAVVVGHQRMSMVGRAWVRVGG